VRVRLPPAADDWDVPKGKFGTLKAYPLQKAYSFEAYSRLDGKYVTKGVARQAVGYRYEHSVR
jgi:hypothetical protein